VTGAGALVFAELLVDPADEPSVDDGVDSEPAAGVTGAAGELVVAGTVPESGFVATVVGGSAARILRLATVRAGATSRAPDTEVLTVRVTTWLETRRVVPTGVAWWASPTRTTAPATEASRPPRLVSRSRRSAASRLSCASFMA
jgi:hypothetical protein